MSANDEVLLSIRPATIAERPSALELLLSAQPADRRQEQIAEWLDEAQHADTLDGLWVAVKNDCLVGAALGRRQPGQSATIWPAQLTESSSALGVEGRLLAAVVDWLAAGEVRSAQALLPSENGPEHDQLIAAGFLRVADLLLELCFLDKRTPVSTASSTTPAVLTFIPYDPQFRTRLTMIVQQTYQGSLDCPILDRARDLNDVLDGYAAHGDGGTAGWFLIEHAGVDAGCLLLAHDHHLGYTELVYMGLVPEARGNALGRELVRFAQDVARSAGLLRMSLAVDAGNFPAITAYEQMGFIAWEKKTAYFRRIVPRATSGKRS